MSLSISVMAHPARVHLLVPLLRSLHETVDVVPVAWDREGEPRRDHDRIWRNCRSAWEMHNPDAQWHLVLQDDAVIPAGLARATESALRWIPSKAAVSLYLGQVRPQATLWSQLADRARECEASWIVGPRLMWGVALILPTVFIPEMLAWGDRQHGMPDDQRIGAWAKRKGLEAWYPWPSFVDHAPDGSLIGYQSVRTAHETVKGGLEGWSPGGAVIRPKGTVYR